jgi:hypothetical protein
MSGGNKPYPQGTIAGPLAAIWPRPLWQNAVGNHPNTPKPRNDVIRKRYHRGMKMEKTDNQFTLDDALRILSLAFPRYFQLNPFDERSSETAMLLALLQKGYIQCVSQRFQPAKKPEELQAQAERLAGVLRQNSYIRILRSALHVFSEYQPDLLGTMYGALYYPELKLYVYVSYLTPKTLLNLFAEPACEQVAVFTGIAKGGRKNRYMLFKRVIAWEEYDRFVQNQVCPEPSALSDAETKE